jgi:hypothetical protein
LSESLVLLRWGYDFKMKKCPSCQNLFTEDLEFCLEDGSRLVSSEVVQNRRKFPSIIKWFLIIGGTLLLAIASAFAWNEYANSQKVTNLTAKLKETRVFQTAEIDGFWQEYQSLGGKSLFNNGVVELNTTMKAELVEFSDRTINKFKECSDKKEDKIQIEQWNNAKTNFERAMQIDSGDASVKAKFLYCEGQTKMLEGLKTKSKAKLKEAKDKFTEAADLQKNWADPYFGLALTYAYGFKNTKETTKNFDKADKLGWNLADCPFAVATAADRLQAEADAELKKGNVTNACDYWLQSNNLYAQIKSFGTAKSQIAVNQQKYDANCTVAEEPLAEEDLGIEPAPEF